MSSVFWPVVILGLGLFGVGSAVNWLVTLM
jgi:hypothetical protein